MVRDATGIAHITADTTHDLFVAQGYVHASERMWQMEVWRHISAGRLAELFGASQLDTDKFIRTLGWRVAAQRDLDAVAPEARAILDAYTEGVNVWLDGHRGSLGLAFLAAGVTPEPWTDLDTIAWGKVQAWNLGGNFDSEVFRYLADAEARRPGPDRRAVPGLSRGRPGHHADRPARIRRRRRDAERSSAEATGDRRPTSRPPLPGRSARPRPPPGARSPASARDSSRPPGSTAPTGSPRTTGSARTTGSSARGCRPTGGALLANDPHLGISMPSIWFINGLHCRTVSAACPFDVAGVSFPGVPGVVLGHNARIAWGATNIDPDVQDLVIETVDPANPNAYMHDGVSTPFEIRHEQIKVSGRGAGRPRDPIHGPRPDPQRRRRPA